MKRIYLRVVAIVVVPPLLLLLLLEQADTVHGTGSLARTLRAIEMLLAFSSGQHPEFWWQILVLLVAGFLFFAAVDWSTERWGRGVLAGVTAALEPETSQVYSRWEGSRFLASARGTFRQREVSSELLMSFARRFDDRRLTISVTCRSPWSFRITRRSAGARVLEWLGEAHEPSGDAALDSRLLFSFTDRAFRDWVRGPDTKRTLLALTEKDGVSTIEVSPDDESVLRIASEPLSFFRRDPFVERVSQVLEVASALAGSFERHAPQPHRGPEPVAKEAGLPAEPSGSRTGRSWGVAGLIVGGVLLLFGLPGIVFYGLGGRPTPALGYVFTALPLAGMGMLVAGIVRWRRSARAGRDSQVRQD